jgi:hypothetical protein
VEIMLNVIERIKPKGSYHWDKVETSYNRIRPRNAPERDKDSIKWPRGVFCAFVYICNLFCKVHHEFNWHLSGQSSGLSNVQPSRLETQIAPLKS